MDVKTLLASAAVAAVVSVTTPALVSYVELQTSSPGTAQTGHSNITGRSLADRFGAGTPPALARIQVADSGTLQGVRAVTFSGTSILGQSTALSGFGSGGYFTSAATNARAVYGESLSQTGNGIGGFFKCRSATGTGLTASNSSLGSKVDICGPNGAVYTGTGTVTKDFGAGVKGAIPIAYGAVAIDGTVFGSGSGNWTSGRSSTGHYFVSIAGENIGYGTHPTVAMMAGAGMIRNVTAAGSMDFDTFDTTGTPADTYFTFVMYKTVPGANYPSVPTNRYANDLVWSMKQPVEFAKYQADCRKAEQIALGSPMSSP